MVKYAFLCIILTVSNSVANCPDVEMCVRCVVVVGNRLLSLLTQNLAISFYPDLLNPFYISELSCHTECQFLYKGR